MARISLEERLNQIEDKISEKSFRENKGLGNEVGYYIFDYHPKAELEVRNHIAYLKERINNGNKDFKIIEIDLYHLMIQILEEEGYLEAFFDFLLLVELLSLAVVSSVELPALYVACSASVSFVVLISYLFFAPVLDVTTTAV